MKKTMILGCFEHIKTKKIRTRLLSHAEGWPWHEGAIVIGVTYQNTKMSFLESEMLFFVLKPLPSEILEQNKSFPTLNT